MGKRKTEQTFEKKPRDFYGTIDPAAVKPLKKVLDLIQDLRYAEPCYGNGDLSKLLSAEGCDRVTYTSDIRPDSKASVVKDALTLTKEDLKDCDLIITNPPFTWKVLKPMMDHFLSLKPTALLLPADYMHNVRMGPYMNQCECVISVGRLYWEENKVKGVDNYAWYLFAPWGTEVDVTQFVGRTFTGDYK